MKKLFATFLFVSVFIFSQAQPFAKRMGGNGVDIARSTATDAAGNVYTTGYFLATADFDPGSGTYNLTNTSGSGDVFVQKLDASGNFVWARSFGSTSSDFGYGITVDASGNVYVTGIFSGTVDFDPGAATYNLTSSGSTDIFVLKLDASGNLVWARKMGGVANDSGLAIAVDASGNVYSTGAYPGTADFDPGAGTYSLTASAGTDVYISKLDASGNFVWAKSIGSTSADAGNSVTTDASGNVYVTGSYGGTVDFDPGAGTYNLTATGSLDAFVLKVDASGTLVWARSIGGTTADAGNDVVVDASGNVYTTGYYSGTVDFDPGAGTYNIAGNGTSNEIFVLKLDASGAFVWAGGVGSSGNDIGYGLSIDASGNVYTAGQFGGTADFDPGAGSYSMSTVGSTDVFVLKLDASGNLVWARSVGGTGGDSGYGLALDASGNALIAGGFIGTVDFDPGVGVYNLTATGSTDVFVLKLNGSGYYSTLPLKLLSFTASAGEGINQLQWATASEENTRAFVIEKSANGQTFTAIATVAAKGSGNNRYAYDDKAAGNTTYYRLKMTDNDGQYTYSPIATVRGAAVTPAAFAIYPNPVQGKATLQVTNRSLIGSVAKLVDMAGNTVWQYKLTKESETLNLQGVRPGVYTLYLNGAAKKLMVE